MFTALYQLDGDKAGLTIVQAGFISHSAAVVTKIPLVNSAYLEVN